MRAASSVGGEGFHHVVGGPRFEGPGNEIFLAVGGEEDDGQRALFLDIVHQIDPVDPRQPHIQQDEMGPRLGNQTVDLPRFSGHYRLIA